MFDVNLVRTLVDLIIRSGVGYNVQIIQHALPDKPPGKIKKFHYNSYAEPHIQFLKAYIINTPSICKVFNNRQYNYGGISYTMLPENLIEWLVMQSQSIGSEIVVTNLYKFLKLGFTPLNKILAISGLTIQEKIIISENIIIIPIQDCQANGMKFESSPKILPSPSPMGGIHIADEKFARAAAVKSIQMKTINESNYDYPEVQDNTLLELTAFLTLQDHFSPMVFNSWFELEEWIPKHQLHLFSVTPGNSELSYKQEYLLTQEIWDNLNPIYLKFISLSPQDRSMLVNVLHRINHSKVRWLEVDRVIDLGVALESILLQKGEEKTIKAKFSSRAEWLFASTKNITIDIEKFFKAFYKCRSNAMHDGILADQYDTNEGMITVTKFIDTATMLSLILIKEIIHYGSVPNWKKLKL